MQAIVWASYTRIVWRPEVGDEPGPDALLAPAPMLADQVQIPGNLATSVIPAYFVPAPICQT